MKIIDKLSPRFLQKLDKQLLLNNPTLWVLKLHHLLFWQFCISVFSILLAFLHPQNIGSFPAVPFLITIICVSNAIVFLLWLYLSNQFDIRTRNNSKPIFYEQYKVLSLALGMILLVLNAFVTVYIFNYQTTKLVHPLSEAEFDQISSTTSSFSSSLTEYEQGYYYNSVYDSLTRESTRYEVPISKDSILKHCEIISQYNLVYGDGKTYSKEKIYFDIKNKEANNFNEIDESVYLRLRYLDPLEDNVQYIDRSFRTVSTLFYGLYKDAVALFISISIVLTILICLISYYKYFGIYKLISGILSPALFSVLFGFGTYLIFGLLDINTNNSEELFLYFFAAIIVATILYYLGFSSTYRSNKRIIALQIWVVVVPGLFGVFYFEVIHDYIKCLPYINTESLLESYNCTNCIPNPNYEACVSHKTNFRFVWQLALFLLYLTVALPTYLKALYRQYYLPVK